MKFLTILFMITFLNQNIFGNDQIKEALKNSLAGIYAGNNCELHIETEEYGSGYYKTFKFFNDGSLVNTETFHVGLISDDAELDGNGDLYYYLKDEVGSDGEDRYITIEADFIKLGPNTYEPVNFFYKYFSHTMIIFPISKGRFECNNMVRIGSL